MKSASFSNVLRAFTASAMYDRPSLRSTSRPSGPGIGCLTGIESDDDAVVIVLPRGHRTVSQERGEIALKKDDERAEDTQTETASGVEHQELRLHRLAASPLFSGRTSIELSIALAHRVTARRVEPVLA